MPIKVIDPTYFLPDTSDRGNARQKYSVLLSLPGCITFLAFGIQQPQFTLLRSSSMCILDILPTWQSGFGSDVHLRGEERAA